jgi:tRNA(adenine34) deaminase
MRRALALAQEAANDGEVPVGAVVVLDGEIVGEGRNQPIATSDPTAHAEIVALRAAATRLKNYRLSGVALVVTVEPCLMCVGAMVHARIGTVVYGTPEPRTGALGSAIAAHETPGLNHRLAVLGGVLEDDCRTLMQDFFRRRRGGGDQTAPDPL